ncbi:hypothetical protein SELMODRAFT_438825 [Selaginella moellendorffii]|uniref:Uncharacterized protein n=1 Tax=Selaginella moellendorffii TaxID=88036 RepID=D8QZP9_SELML|nr:uncharacterized protein LOC9654666 [Selaginella moellendorffii]EFJ34442.1 hypothetical protein SELMODRAFT_438825 [Selaginella moellendorffii]|eukprot:XP_002964109.1 uncharacterized protein LOC9654666 [Selaginella moellendorffii]
MAESIQFFAGSFSTALPAHRNRSLPNGSSLFFARMRRRLAAAAPENWEGVIKLEEEEASTLIDLCRDLDWEGCVDALRREALRMNDATRAGAARVAQGVSCAASGGNGNGEQWDYKEAVADLRRRASFQAAEEMVKNLNPPDYAQAVSKLAHQILNACDQHLQDDTCGGGNGSTSPATAPSFLLATLAGLHGFIGFSAMADEFQSQAQAAQDKIPSWLPTAVLGAPVAAYLIFSVYRDQVNPQAKLTDFFFALAAMFIVGNLITSATLGVRLY